MVPSEFAAPISQDPVPIVHPQGEISVAQLLTLENVQTLTLVLTSSKMQLGVFLKVKPLPVNTACELINGSPPGGLFQGNWGMSGLSDIQGTRLDIGISYLATTLDTDTLDISRIGLALFLSQ